jgi:flagellar L-ring protein precursor FlgH
MSYRPHRPAIRFIALCAALLMLSGCNAFSRIASIGSEPPLSPINNPVAERNYKPVALPMPRPQPVVFHANSLWRPGSRQFFKDQRASDVGDILTVRVTIQDSAKLNNSTTTARNNGEDADLTNFLGLESQLGQVLPEAVNPGSLVSLGSQSATSGSGTVDRGEEIDLEVAALITQILPNGNLVISGRQEVRVNYEVRELMISGVVRPEDITGQNTIDHTKIAEARIAYGGRGHLTNVQQPRYGQQLFDVIFPF